MTTTATRPETREERILLHDISWEEYVAVRQALWEHPAIRMAYLEGTLEIMSPSREHEKGKKWSGRLIETWSLEMDVPLHGLGSTTFRNQAADRGIEPDECYCLTPDQEYPDIAIEVIVTHGGIDRLAIYQGLGVAEVWFFEKGRFHLHRLGPDGHRSIPRSEVLPTLDIERLTHYVLQPNQFEAVKAWRDELRAR